MWCHEIPRTFWWHCSQSCVYSDEATWCNAVEKYLLKTPGNGLSQTLTYRMSLDASALKNLCLWCEFQSRLLFIISLLLKTFLTALEITQLRHGSRINTDQFTKQTLKLLGGCVDMLPGKILDLNSLMSPFLGFWVIQTRYWPVPFSLDETSNPFSRFQLGKCFH